MDEEMSTGAGAAPFGGFGDGGFGGFGGLGGFGLSGLLVSCPAAAVDALPAGAATAEIGAAIPITSTAPAATATPRTVRPRRNIDIRSPRWRSSVGARFESRCGGIEAAVIGMTIG